MSATLLVRSLLSRAFSSTTASSSVSVPHHQHSQYIPSSISQISPAIVSHAQGSYIYTTNNRKLLDFSTGIGVTNLGHCHEAVNRAAMEQLQKGVHLQVNCVTSQPLLRHAELLKSILPSHLQSSYQVLYSNSGAEAIENSIKLARASLKRQVVIVFQGGFHGRTIAASSLTTAKYVYRSNFQPSMSGVYVVPFPYCHRCPVSHCCPEQNNIDKCCMNPLEQLHLCIKQQASPDEVAAILIEPVLGEGGYIVPPVNFLKALRQIADEIGCLLIADEVQSGFGRCGAWFASSMFDMNPDVIVMAKGIANGFPLSACVAEGGVWAKMKVGSVGGTFGGNPVSCAAACAVIESIQRENILENVKIRGEEFRTALRQLAQRYPIADVRGIGLMNAIEFKDGYLGVAARVSKACEMNDLLVLTAGVYESLRFIPPLNISRAELEEGVEKLERALKQVFR